MSEKELLRRFTIKNPELVENFYNNNKSVFVVIGHYANWEWLIAMNKVVSHKVGALYKPLSNSFFEQQLYKSRNKFGLVLIPVLSTKKYLEEHKKQLTLTIIAGDQTPSNVRKCYWTNFMNQDTPVLLGTEKFAKDYNYPVLFGKISKIKRGFYEMSFTVLSENPVEDPPLAITEKHTRFLENIIQENPELWLWSHRRWKHKRIKESY